MVLSRAVGLAWGCARELSAILVAPVREAASTGRTKHEASIREARNLSRRSEAHMVKTHWALGWRPFAQQAADHFFGMAEPVHSSHICPIHPELQCVTHGRQRNGVVP